MDKCEFLDTAFKPPQLPKKPDTIKTWCAMIGNEIGEGYRVDSLVTDATSQPHEIFRYPSEYCSPAAARLFKSMRGDAAMISNLHATTDGGSKPLISKDSAIEKNRPCWRDIIEALPVGILTVSVFTEESKRRFWLNAPLTITGSSWQPYLHWRNISRVLTIDVSVLQKVLATIEPIYSLGFSKDAILNGLFDNFQQVSRLGFAETSKLESSISLYRDSDELLLATFVAQKTLPDVQKIKGDIQSCQLNNKTFLAVAPALPEMEPGTQLSLL